MKINLKFPKKEVCGLKEIYISHYRVVVNHDGEVFKDRPMGLINNNLKDKNLLNEYENFKDDYSIFQKANILIFEHTRTKYVWEAILDDNYHKTKTK